MRCIPFTVSFDALGTLIEVTGGVGSQYRAAYAAFLGQYGIDLTSSCPCASSETIEKLAFSAIGEQMNTDRQMWIRSTNPKEMPFGGDDDVSLLTFWGKVLEKTYRHPSFYQGADPALVQTMDALWTSQPPPARAFTQHVVFDLFGSDKTHSWLPEGRRTLGMLRDWNAQRQRQSTSGNGDGCSSSTAAPMMTLAAPPFVVSNMDPRLHTVFTQLGALDGGPNGQPPPLLSRVITARDVGYAKPSPVGVITGVRDIAKALLQQQGVDAADRVVLEEATGELLKRHVHVGDSRVDADTCKNVGCTYVKCDVRTGVTWELLKAALQELEAEFQA